ncbi:MAG: aminotransferase class V-fold PLP-dependent enzyme [bacterium]
MDVAKIRNDFPFLQRKINDKPIIYLDNAATTQKPTPVLETLVSFYQNHCSNIHRGTHTLSLEASEIYEKARRRVARFLNADEDEIVFVRNATEAINLVARSLPISGKILLSLFEHHSNILPWQHSRELIYFESDPDGTVCLSDLALKSKQSVQLLTVSHVSNVLGTVNPLEQILAVAKENRVLTLVDASQSVPNMKIDVKQLDCDFLTFSGHKMLAPFSIGVLFVKRDVYPMLQPFMLGGGSVTEVHVDHYLWENPPQAFEAGTPNVAGAVALAAAIDYLEKIGLENILAHEKRLVKLALADLSRIKNLQVYGTEDVESRIGLISFGTKNLAAHALAKVLNLRENIMIRSGFHCAQPLHEKLGIGPSARASFYIYNTEEEVRKMTWLLKKVVEFM